MSIYIVLVRFDSVFHVARKKMWWQVGCHRLQGRRKGNKGLRLVGVSIFGTTGGGF